MSHSEAARAFRQAWHPAASSTSTPSAAQWPCSSTPAATSTCSTDRQLTRVDHAVGHLSHVAADLHGDIAIATRWLLSPDPDPGGARTVRAITRLAALTHVDDAAAPALAASLHVAAKPVQASLFDTPGPSEVSA